MGDHEMIVGNLATSAAICVAAATLEGVCAGSGVKAFFATLRTPKHSAPLPVWYAIGVMYYVTFGFVLYRLLGLPEGDTLTRGTFALVATTMIANALWNLIFFRARNLFVAFIAGSAAPIPDVVLLVCLLRLDHLAAVALVPYLIYRAYAVWWGYALWTANK
jgi:tryptophan-rich sensory protein